jgi:cytochrome c-type biogenesis protein CcsB
MWIGIVQLIYFGAGILFFLGAYSRRAWLLRIATILALTGSAVQLGFIIHRGILARRLPITNTYETLVLFSLLLMVSYFLAYRRYGLPALGGFASLVAATALSACSLMSSEIEPLLPSLKSNWLLLHVLASFLGYAAFGLAFASATAYLLLDLGLARPLGLRIATPTDEMNPSDKSATGPGCRRREFIRTTSPIHFDSTSASKFAPAGWSDRLPASDFLDWFTYRAIAFGFPLLTLGIVTGAIWADACWGSYWNWDPKETWSFITWFIYAGCLHMRFTGMRGRTSAIMAVIGFGCVIFTYFGVNYWLAGLHDYA